MAPDAQFPHGRLPDNIRAFAERIQRHALSIIARSTVVIYAPHSETDTKTPGVAGTGVLLEIAGDNFLITAAHVAQIGFDYKFGLYITSGEPQCPFVLIGEEMAYAADPDGLVDIAAIRLSQSVVEMISSGRRFLRLSQLSPGDRGDPNAGYGLFGYPQANLVHDPSSNTVGTLPMPYFTVPYESTKTPPPETNPAIHILFDFQMAGNVVGSGHIVEAADPHGMSGCGVWRMLHFNKGMKSWSPEEVVLVGIEHTWWKGGYDALMATQIQWAVEAIYRNCPNLRSAIDLNWGLNWRPK